MRKPNPTITKIQVRHRAFTTYETFRKWVMDNHAYTVYNALETSAYSDEHFCMINAQGLHMKFREAPHRCEYDQLRLKLTLGNNGQLFYQVSFMEYFEDEDGPAFNSVCVEEFAMYDLHKALECFMERWNSDRPWAASSVKKSSHSDFERVYRKVGIGSIVKTNLVMTPKEWQARLMVDPKKLYVVRPDSGFATKMGTNELPSTEGMVTVFKDGVVLEDSDVCPPIEQIRAAKVGYTGDKNKHGSGSLDHISW